MADATTTTSVTAQSILTTILLAPTTFLIPSLPTLRALLQSTSASLSASTTDSELKRYLKEVVRDRKLVEDDVRRAIQRYELGRGDSQQLAAAGEDVEDDGDEFEELELDEVVERLEGEEKKLERELEGLQRAVEGTKGELEAAVAELAKVPRLPVAPSVKRALDDSLSNLERDAKRLRAQVDEVGRRAAQEP